MPKGIFARPVAGMHARQVLHKTSIPRALEESCRNFEREVGGRVALIDHLAHVPLTDEQELMVGALADPRNDELSLARICLIYGLKFVELIQLFRNAGLVKAQVAAMQRVWAKLPDVAGDVMDRAVTHTIYCSRCAGSGKTKRFTKETDKEGNVSFPSHEEDCSQCQGRGEVTIQPALETQKLALEIGGLRPTGGPQVQVNVQQNASPSAGGAGPLGDFLKRADAKLYAQPIDTTATRVEDDEDDVQP